jgi:hypothetical protein
MRCRARLAASPISEASSKRQGDGQRFQKKAMNTKSNQRSEASAPANVRPSSVSKTSEETQHDANRKLSTQKVLEFLRTKLPQQYEVAEIVGSWVWVEFSSDRQRLVADVLWGLGFHWNNRRGVWQHPCGRFEPFSSHPKDPRSKYGSRFAANN